MRRPRQSPASEANARLSDAEIIALGFVNVTEALQFLAIGRTTLYELIKKGDVVAANFRGRRVITRRSMLTYAEKRVERTDRVA